MKKGLLNIRKNPPKEIDGKALIFDDFAQGYWGYPKATFCAYKTEKVS